MRILNCCRPHFGIRNESGISLELKSVPQNNFPNWQGRGISVMVMMMSSYHNHPAYEIWILKNTRKLYNYILILIFDSSVKPIMFLKMFDMEFFVIYILLFVDTGLDVIRNIWCNNYRLYCLLSQCSSSDLKSVNRLSQPQAQSGVAGLV